MSRRRSGDEGGGGPIDWLAERVGSRTVAWLAVWIAGVTIALGATGIAGWYYNAEAGYKNCAAIAGILTRAQNTLKQNPRPDLTEKERAAAIRYYQSEIDRLACPSAPSLNPLG